MSAPSRAPTRIDPLPPINRAQQVETALAQYVEHAGLKAGDRLPAERLDTVRYVCAPQVDDTSGLLRLVGPAWLVVWVDPPAALRERVADLAGHLRVMTTSEAAGSVDADALVGGGPRAGGWSATADRVPGP